MPALRLPAFLPLLCLVFCANPAAPQKAEDSASLQAQVQSLAAAHHGDVALFAENLGTHQTVSLAPDTVVQTASTIKLAILYEALEQIRAGKVHFEDPITLAKADQVPGSGVLLFFDAPLQLTFKDILTMMIVMSDNTAANLAMDHLGIASINARMAKLGLRNTYLYKKIFTPAPAGTVLPPDQKRFGLGKTTPAEIASLMGKLARCELAEPGQPELPGDAALCQAALHMLHLQFYRSAIPRYLDELPGTTADSIASKSGSLDAARSDVAAISTKSGLIVLAIYTFNNKDRTWGVDQESQLTMARLARAIVQAWSPDGLAPWPAATPAKQADFSRTRPRPPAADTRPPGAGAR